MSSLAARLESPPRLTDNPYWRDGLIFAWHPTSLGGDDFAGVRGRRFDATVDDSSGDATFTLGKYGRAWAFSGDGTNDRIDLGSIPSTDPLSFAGKEGGLTIAARFRFDGYGGGSFPRLIDKSNLGNAGNGWAIWLSNAAYIAFRANSSEFRITPTLTAGQYYTLVWIVDDLDASHRAFLDGVDQSPSSVLTGTSAISAAETNAAIGNWNHNTNRMWQGLISNVFAWDRALSDHHGMEFQPDAIYWRPKPIVPGFVAEEADQDIEGTLLSDVDILNHGKISVDITGSFLQDADELYHGEIATGAVNVQGSILEDTGNLFHGLISPQNLFGSLLTDADTLNHGEIDTGVVDITGSILEDTDQLNHGLITLNIKGSSLVDADVLNRGKIAVNITGSILEDADVLNHGTIATEAFNLDGSLFEDTDQLNHGLITIDIAGSSLQDADILNHGLLTKNIAGSILEDADTLHHGAISLNLNGSLFEDADTINHGAVSPINMFGSLLEDADNLFDGLLLNVATDIEGTLFADEDIFYHSFLLYDILGSIFAEEDDLFHGKIAGGVQVKIPRIVQTGLRGKLVRDYQSVYDDYPDPGV